MRYLLLLSIFLSTINLFAQDKKEITLKTEVSEATVFINGAQVLRKKTIELPAGVSMLKFTNLSPYLDVKSLQLKTGEKVVVLSINHQFNFTDSIGHSKELESLVFKLNAIDDKIILENINLSIADEELAFLKDNRIIGGKNQEVSFINLKETSNFYKEKITVLKLKENESRKNITQLSLERSKIVAQINQINGLKPTPMGEVWAKVETKSALKCDFELSYFTANAGWFPIYDIRAKSIADPIELVYKANIHQNTKDSWKNIKLRLSSGNPNLGGVAPQLKTYYLNYGQTAPKYQNTENLVTGKIVDSKDRSALPGVTIIIKGTTIGTISDLNGNYSISIPSSNCVLEFSFIGFERKTISVSSGTLNVELEESKTMDEVVVVGYGSARENDDYQEKSTSSSASYSSKNEKKKVREVKQQYIESIKVENETSFEFDVKNLYTINSDNKSMIVDINSYSLDAKYEYYCAPKADKDAFLMANILDWEKYNIMEGEANIFFENTFVGKTILDVRNVTDTLSISLGRDKSVSVKRTKIKDFCKTNFFGGKKEEMRTWQIEVKNNKKQTINMVLYDQVPVSNLNEIEVTLENISGANLNKETGELKWKFGLDLNGKKDFEVKYKVKYPKDQNLNVE